MEVSLGICAALLEAWHRHEIFCHVCCCISTNPVGQHLFQRVEIISLLVDLYSGLLEREKNTIKDLPFFWGLLNLKLLKPPLSSCAYTIPIAVLCSYWGQTVPGKMQINKGAAEISSTVSLLAALVLIRSHISVITQYDSCLGSELELDKYNGSILFHWWNPMLYLWKNSWVVFQYKAASHALSHVPPATACSNHCCLSLKMVLHITRCRDFFQACPKKAVLSFFSLTNEAAGVDA